MKNIFKENKKLKEENNKLKIKVNELQKRKYRRIIKNTRILRKTYE